MATKNTLSMICLALPCCLALFCLAPSAAQASIEVGDTINLHNGPGSNGGVFNLYKGSHGGSEVFEIKTFCVQISQGIYFHTDYTIDNISQENDDGAVLQDKTKWAYGLFLDDDFVDVLATHGYTGTYAGASTNLPTNNAGRDLANAIQKFIWEGVGTGLGTGGIGSNYNNSLYDALGTGWAALNSTWVDPGRVAVLNIAGRQDQLYRLPAQNVPEPTSVAVWGLLGVCTMGRRNRKHG